MHLQIRVDITAKVAAIVVSRKDAIVASSNSRSFFPPSKEDHDEDLVEAVSEVAEGGVCVWGGKFSRGKRWNKCMTGVGEGALAIMERDHDAMFVELSDTDSVDHEHMASMRRATTYCEALGFGKASIVDLPSEE
uniref:Uncharacterized protein n=1 Tax=Hordeum vulgare subsp. vulgare TaxID=112509 RepID=A0A8I6Z6J0_HORVV